MLYTAVQSVDQMRSFIINRPCWLGWLAAGWYTAETTMRNRSHPFKCQNVVSLVTLAGI